jgi:cytoplasmic iron level regulating protein YaaA (DUF328/UPF0246 family)
MEKSRVLILIICSNTKKAGGVPNWDRDQSILARLPPASSNLLAQGRSRVLDWIKKTEVTRNRVRIADMAPNRGLVHGPDLGGTLVGGLYRPAAERLSGRLFAKLEKEGTSLLTSTVHHVLILSGLYGIVMPQESIQDYQCHIEDSRFLHNSWTRDDLLTRVLLDYLKRHVITHVFDLTAQNSYRRLIAWTRVRFQCQAVLHCFGSQSAGNASLIPLGFMAAQMLSMAESELLEMRPDDRFVTPYELLYLQPFPEPPPEGPQEVEEQRTKFNVADELDRMRRCFIRICAECDNSPIADREWGVSRQIQRLVCQRCIPIDVGNSMLNVVHTRNDIEYGKRRGLPDRELREARRKYLIVREWAERKRLRLPDECLEL